MPPRTAMMVGVVVPETGRVGVADGLPTAIAVEVGVAVAPIDVDVGAGVIVGVAVGVAVAQTQLVLVVQDGFLQTPTQQTMVLGQSELVLHEVPHCGTGVAVGVAVGLGVGLAQLVLVGF